MAIPRRNSGAQALAGGPPKHRRRKDFVERTLATLARRMERALYSEELAKADGLLQCLDPRVKVVGLLALIIATAMARSLPVILGIFAVALLLALLSHVPIGTLASRVWLGALLFTGLIVLPAIFITPGPIVYRMPLFGWPITAQGMRSAVFLILRVETTATLALLLVLCTLWTHVLKSLRVLGVPVIFIVILGMTYRYIFLLLATTQDMLESRQSRMIGELTGPDKRRLASASVGVLLSKTFQLSGEVYLAMQSRGFRGEVYTLDDFQMQPRDWMALAAFILLAGLAIWFGSLGVR